MSRPLRTSLAAAAASVLLLAGLTACGSESDQASDEPGVAAEGAAASDADDDIDLPDEGETVDPDEFTAWMLAGLEKSTTAQMTMTTDTGGMGGVEAKGQIDYTQTPAEMSMTMTMDMLGGDPMDLRVVDGVMYMNMGAMSNDKFFEFDLSDPDNLPPGMEDMADQMDPLAAFEDFGPALDQVTFVGTEDVEGDDLHHFAITMDTSKMATMEDLPADSGVPSTIDYDLWFDEDFRMRQMDMSMAMGTKVDVSAEIYDWDEPVTIEAPSDDQISDAPMGQMAG